MKYYIGGLVAALIAYPAVACASDDTTAVTGRLTSGHVTTARLLPGERVTIAGRAVPAQRPVTLQVRRHGRWVAVATKSASRSGRYSFVVRATTTPQRYRPYAAPTRQVSHHYRQEAGRAVTVRAHKPRGTIAFLGAPIGQTGSGSTNRYPVFASFSPARAGTKVIVQRLAANGHWTTAAKGKENRAGQFVAQLPMSPSSPKFYRAVAKPPHGAKPIATNTQNATFRRLDWSDDFSGSSVNPAKWTLRSVAGKGRTCAQSTMSQARVGHGAVTLSVRRRTHKNYLGQTVYVPKSKDCPYGYFDNAGLQSKASFLHGVFAARIRFEHGGGQHGSMFVQGWGRQAAELDAVEYFGDRRRDFGVGRGVYPAPDRKSKKHQGGIYPQARGLMAGRTPSNSWHVYAVQWTGSGYLFTIDGKPTLYTRKPYVASTSEFVNLTLVTSDWEVAHLPKDRNGQVVASQSQMQVDWVRVWN